MRPNAWMKALGSLCLVLALGCDSSSSGATDAGTSLPLPPYTVSVESGDGQNLVQWSAVPGVEGYNLYWSETGPVTRSGGHVIMNAVSPFVHSGLSNGVAYHYLVTTFRGAAESADSDEVSAVPRAPIPGRPEHLSAVAGDASVTLTWSPIGGVETYVLHWSGSAGVVPGAPGVQRMEGIPGTRFRHEGLANGTRYFYVLAAVGTKGEGPASAEVSATPLPPSPGAPSNVVAVPGDGVTVLSWSGCVGASSYNVYWSLAPGVVPGAPGVTRVTGITEGNFSHSGIGNGVPHFYVVTAVGTGGEGPPSAEVVSRPMPAAPGAPALLTATPRDGVVDLTWSPSEGATSYNVYGSAQPGVWPGAAGVTHLAVATSTSYSHTGLANGVPVHYVVTAVGPGGESPPSVEARATPRPPAPSSPSGLQATPGDGLVHLAWSPSTGATSYSVYFALSPGVTPGAAGVSLVAGIETAAYTHLGAINGQTYHYAVTAVGPGGESAPSAEASAMAAPPAPAAPAGVTAIASRKEGSTNVTLQWYDSPGATGYHLYRGTEPGVAGYIQDRARARKYADVTAPYLDDDGIVTGTTFYYVVTAFGPFSESQPSAEVSARLQGGGESGGDSHGSGGGGAGHGQGGKGGEKGGEEGGFGNNLSFPVVFADGYGTSGARISGAWVGSSPEGASLAIDFASGLRPLSTELPTQFPFLESSSSVSIGGTRYFPQSTASTWQAEWRNNAAGTELPVLIDWGDALSSRSYTATSMVRIEAALIQDETVIGDPADTMVAYRMKTLAGSRDTEIQGTDGTTLASVARTVFAVNARLRIERLSDLAGFPDVVVFDGSIADALGEAESEEGHSGGGGGGGGSGGGGGGSGGSGGPPLKFSAELNGAGKIVYGSNLMLRKVAIPANVSKAGRWRLTFLLDPTAQVAGQTSPNHVRIVGTKDAKAEVAADGQSSSIVLDVR